MKKLEYQVKRYEPDDMNELSSSSMTGFPPVSGRPLSLHHGCLAAILSVPYFAHWMVESFGTYHTLICMGRIEREMKSLVAIHSLRVFINMAQDICYGENLIACVEWY